MPGIMQCRHIVIAVRFMGVIPQAGSPAEPPEQCSAARTMQCTKDRVCLRTNSAAVDGSLVCYKPARARLSLAVEM